MKFRKVFSRQRWWWRSCPPASGLEPRFLSFSDSFSRTFVLLLASPSQRDFPPPADVGLSPHFLPPPSPFSPPPPRLSERGREREKLEGEENLLKWGRWRAAPFQKLLEQTGPDWFNDALCILQPCLPLCHEIQKCLDYKSQSDAQGSNKVPGGHKLGAQQVCDSFVSTKTWRKDLFTLIITCNSVSVLLYGLGFNTEHTTNLMH